MQLDPTSTKMPDAEESISVLKELIALWESHGTSIAVPKIGDSIMTGVAIQVQVEHAVRVSEAVIVLAREGLFIQVAPLVRLVLECAVSAAWYTLHPDNVKSSMLEAARLKNLLIEGLGGLTDSPYEPHAEWTKISEELAEFRSAEAHQFEQRCSALAGGSYLYPYYRLLSEASHGGTALVEEYMDEVPKSTDNPTGFAFHRHAPYKYRDGALALNVVVLALALRAWDDIAPDHPDRAQIDEIAERIGAQVLVQAATKGSETDSA